MGFTGSKRRVIPLQVQTLPQEEYGGTSAAQRSMVPPKSPLHGARTSASMGGFDRMMLLRNMNVSLPMTGAEESGPRLIKPTGLVVASTSIREDVSAAQNLKERKLVEARRRVEVQLMRLEDYTNTPEGAARLQRQHERACMDEEELLMQRIIQHEHEQRRVLQRQQQAEEEARLKEMYLAKRRYEMEEQARIAKEKEAARKQALEAKMKALKEEADRKAREEYAARQKKLADEAQAERDVRTAAMEMMLMHVEDELASVLRIEWLADEERQRQIEAEALEWKRYEEREAQRQREETQKRRDAQKEQYEQDRARRMQIHKLQQDRVRTAAADKRRRANEQHGEGITAATSLLRLQSQCEQAAEIPPIQLSPPSSQLAWQEPQSSARRPTTALVTARQAPITALGVIAEQTPVPPPPILPTTGSVHEPLSVDTTITPSGESDTVPGADKGSSNEMSEPMTNARESEAATCDDLQCETEINTQEISPDTSIRHLSNEPTIAVTSDKPRSDESVAPSPTIAERIVIHPELLSLDKLRSEGVTPVAEVFSVTTGSPASDAGLAPRDLLVEFGGITSATPKCIVAIASCLQQNVNHEIALTILRRAERLPDGNDNDAWVQRCDVRLVPCKWKGKGLLGCQLSPFKWPDPMKTTENPMQDEKVDTTRVTATYDPLVFHQVQPRSLAHQVGISDGDVLARCGDLEVAKAGSDAGEALASVAMYFQTNWRDSQRELTLLLQRWDESAQSYAVIPVVLPVLSSDEPLGCVLTTYTQYYYPASTTTDPVSACDECYYTSLASSLHAAALSGHITCLHALLSACSPEFLDWRDDEGRTPLFYACYAHQADAVRCLVAHLQTVAREYDPVSGADAYGDSPLHAAASSDCVDAIVCLLETRFIADVELANTVSQATAAHVAGSEATLRVLYEQFNADLLALDSDGRMPLFYACLRNDPASVTFLCDLHPDFADYADSAGGNTPLHMAAWCGYADVVHALVASLPSIALFAPNQDGLDPRTLAEQSGWSAVAQDLERRMAMS